MPGKIDSEDYDFILVGAGSAACLIASRLSQQLPNHRILVLEAGQHIRDDPRVQTPGLSASLQRKPQYDWQYTSAPEPGLNGRTVDHPRGRLVGGTSAINSHSVVYPNHEWQDRIAEDLLPEEGRANWTAQAMQSCYARWEDRGTGLGAKDDTESLDRLRTSFPPSLDSLQSQWSKVFEELGQPTSESGFVESSAGAVTVTNAIDSSKGERSHAGEAFLEPALKRGNVTLKTGVKVDKIAFHEAPDGDGKLHAKGIRYTDQGEEHLITGREIILCAGVFESPAILERSGIGSKSVLEAANVPLLYELPGVGENLQDHLNCSLSIEVEDSVPTHDNGNRDPALKQASAEEYELHRTGRLAEGGAYSFAFTPLQLLESSTETTSLTTLVSSAVSSAPTPNLRAQYAFLEKIISSPHEATGTTFLLRCQRNRDLQSMPPGTPSLVPGNYLTLVSMLAHPFSRGTCHIASASSETYPAIRFNYLTHPLDTEILARHMRLMERLFQRPVIKALTKPEGRRLPRSHPFPMTDLDQAKEMIRINSATNYHPCGTCAMMKEELGGVVDAHLRVYGTSGVRVCDAAVLPVVPRGNILASVYAWAEKAAEILVREEREREGGRV